MIQISNISKTYRMGDVEVPALRDVSLTIEPGDFVAIMGPSGSGKSTLMHVLGLLDVPDSGSYKLCGSEVSGLSEDELARVRSQVIGFVFQQFHLLARTTALENVTLPLLYSSREVRADLGTSLLSQVGLGTRVSHKPNELSGGQQQRVAIARSLVNEPRIVFADEPTGNLDSTSEKEIMGILHDLNAKGITVILVTHEPEIARHAKRVIRMRDGRVQSDERTGEPTRVPSEVSTISSAIMPTRLTLNGGMQHFRQGAKALLANKVRTGLSMLGILIGVAAVIAMLALGTGARQSIESQLASMGSNLLVLRTGGRRTGGVAQEAGTTTRMTIEDAKALKESVPFISSIAPTVQGRVQAAFGNRNWSTQVQGTTAQYETMRAATPQAGRFFREDENQKRLRVAVIGVTVARELFDDANPLGETIKINKLAFQVIGVLPEKGANGFRDQDDVILIPLNTAMYRVLGKEHVDSMDIEIADGDSMEAAEETIVEVMLKRHRLPASREDAFQVRNMAELQEALSESSRIMSWLLASIAAISLLVGGIGIMNIMLVSVTERTREIGLRKAVGATRTDILLQFLIEAVVITVLGGLAGILLGCGVTFAMSSLAGWAASVSPWSVALAFAFSAGIGVGFGLWPARKASRLSPIVALRYE